MIAQPGGDGRQRRALTLPSCCALGVAYVEHSAVSTHPVRVRVRI